MQFHVPIQMQHLQPAISYQHKMLLVGSCFTEHIGNYLSEVKFPVLQNPNGILFDPLSVCSSLTSYIENKTYEEKDLFYLNEAWHSWSHHSRFSHPDRHTVVETINASQKQAHNFLKRSRLAFYNAWIIFRIPFCPNGFCVTCYAK